MVKCIYITLYKLGWKAITQSQEATVETPISEALLESNLRVGHAGRIPENQRMWHRPSSYCPQSQEVLWAKTPTRSWPCVGSGLGCPERPGTQIRVFHPHSDSCPQTLGRSSHWCRGLVCLFFNYFVFLIYCKDWFGKQVHFKRRKVISMHKK